ncbi:hypothetical protein EGH90_11235 [Kaistella haifensis]|nr:hypothetical protein EGH90_11235 [Kaistella haifensis]
MKKWEKDGKEKIAISLNYNKMQINEKYTLPTVNQRVAGSSPARGAKTYRNVSLFFCFNTSETTSIKVVIGILFPIKNPIR